LFLTADGEIFFNEVNTIPGFTVHSRYANMLGAAGMTFEQIVNTSIAWAVTPEAKKA
jgi:D-alanine---D-serine ligase